MHVLWIATKPPWPPVDGGRLVAARTIEGLVAEGHRVSLIAPGDPEALGAAPDLDALRLEIVPARPVPAWRAGLSAQITRRPWTLVRHDLAAVRRRAAEVARADGPFGRPEVIHAEQVQALAGAESASEAAAEALGDHVPVVLRAQNVESDLWRLLAEYRPLLGPLLRLEARRLAAAEGDTVRRVDAAVALTAEDAQRLGELAGDNAPRVHAVPAPFDAELAPGEERLAGDPPLVIFGSAGWRPNRDGAERFVSSTWPTLRRAWPSARLHLFGLEDLAGKGIETHPAPASSREALAVGSVLVVPLAVASGVRMKILEAWARGVPVIATPAAARGLDPTDGRELWIAESAEEFVDAVAAVRDRARRAAVVSAARRRLVAEHAPEVVARRLASIYADAIDADAGR